MKGRMGESQAVGGFRAMVWFRLHLARVVGFWLRALGV